MPRCAYRYTVNPPPSLSLLLYPSIRPSIYLSLSFRLPVLEFTYVCCTWSWWRWWRWWWWWCTYACLSPSVVSASPSYRRLTNLLLSHLLHPEILGRNQWGEGEERSRGLRVSPGVLRVGCMGGLVNRIVVHGTPYNNRRADIRCIRRGLKGSSRVSISFLPLFFHSFSFFSSLSKDRTDRCF